LDFANLIHFWSILAVFWLKNSQKKPKSKKNKIIAFFCWEASTYQISENFIKRFGFCQFYSFLVNFGYFLVKKQPKKVEIPKKFIYSIFFWWEASTYQISGNFIKWFGFCQFFLFIFDWGVEVSRSSRKNRSKNLPKQLKNPKLRLKLHQKLLQQKWPKSEASAEASVEASAETFAKKKHIFLAFFAFLPFTGLLPKLRPIFYRTLQKLLGRMTLCPLF
jgi:hypothetical protein